MATPEKVIILLLDGASDRPSEILGGKTPLEAAQTPNLDMIARMGANGLMHVIEPFYAPSTDLAHFVLFGYSPQEYPGRGWIEAIGNDIKVSQDELVLRNLFVSASFEPEEGWIIERENISYTEEECQIFSEAISRYSRDEFQARHIYSGKRYGFLIISGPVSEHISDTDPFMSNLPVMKSEPLSEAANREKAEKTSRFLNSYTEWAFRTLTKHEMNMKRSSSGLPTLNFLIAKWPGKAKTISSFFDTTGFKAVMVAHGDLFRGFSKMLNIEFEELPPLENTVSEIEYLASKTSLLLNKGFNFIFLHTKTPDEAAHQKDPFLKRKTIEEIDRGIKAFFDSDICSSPELVFIVTSDHSTPSSGSLIHSGEPVPICVISNNLLKDEVDRFSERDASKGVLGFILGRDFMPLILNLTDRIRYLGSRGFSEAWLSKPDRGRIKPLKFNP